MNNPSAVPLTNQAALSFWRLRRYSQREVDLVCAENNDKLMAARVTFVGDGGLEVTVTQKTWARQEGHYPTIIEFFSRVAQHPGCRSKRGSLIVWLEDGLWESQQQYSRMAPVLAFGRHIHDTTTCLIPDPAFLGSNGYRKELAEIAAWEKELGLEKKPTIFWRGAATGVGIGKVTWENTPRAALALLAKKLDQPQLLDAKFTKISHLQAERQQVFRELGLVADPCEFRQFLRYLFLIEADGYCCAWRSLFLKLATQSVVLKVQSYYEQWYYRDLLPWRHYVPIRSDLSDLLDTYQWLVNHPAELKIIIDQAHSILTGLTIERAVDETSKLCAQIIDCQAP